LDFFINVSESFQAQLFKNTTNILGYLVIYDNIYFYFQLA